MDYSLRSTVYSPSMKYKTSPNLLQKMGFEQWSYLLRAAIIDGKEVRHLYPMRHM